VEPEAPEVESRPEPSSSQPMPETPTHDVEFGVRQNESSSSSSSNQPPPKPVIVPVDPIKAVAKRYEFFQQMENKRKALKGGSPIVPSVIEFACSDSSAIGEIAKQNKISSLRLSESYGDLTSEETLLRAIAAVRRLSKPIHLHGSLPCTPWTQWQNMNLAKLDDSFATKLGKNASYP